ncbi:MAG: hypothetical protein ACK5L2_14300, partial [Planctomyces sp.]
LDRAAGIFTFQIQDDILRTKNRHITSHVSDAVPGELVRSAIDNEFFDVSSLISHSGKCMSSRGHCFWE